MEQTFRLDCKARFDALAEIREFVADSASALGLGDEAIEDLKVCIDEAATNIVKYGYGGKEGQLSIEVSRRDNEILVRVLDDAPSFDPDLVPTPDLERPLNERPMGGMGVHLIRTLTDGVSHRTMPGGGNELILRKRVAG